MMSIAIIGAGMAGLACARQLSEAGLKPVVFDKGRGIGGRVATRRAGDYRFDHGAPCAEARTDGFTDILRGLVDDGHAAVWTDGTRPTQIVGTPGMSSIPKGLAAGLDVRLRSQITAVAPQGAGWRLHLGDTYYDADQVVVTVPAPQIAGLLGDTHPLMAHIARVEMAPGLTLMATITDGVPVVRQGGKNDVLVSIIENSSKPDRPQNDVSAWVAHAGLAFTLVHLEEDLPDIAARMVPLLCERLGVTPDSVTHAVAHRWRYSQVVKPLGKPFVHTSDATLYLGGDWCVGSLVEDAWTSGTAIAADLLARRL
jgi:predicted NAD/FAD-dependent oxidoreductase